jgi:putative addiction module antidote
MVKLRVRKIGKSFAVILPKKALARLGVSEGGRLFLIEGPDGAYQLAHYDSKLAKKLRAVERIIERYRSTLHSLAGR